MSDEQTPAKWERALIEKMVYASVDEQRKARRWGIFFKLFLVVYVLVLLAVAAIPQLKAHSKSHTAIIDLKGLISADSPANADDIAGALQDAFESEGTKGIIIRANSPGGSPVQSEYVYAEIQRLKKAHPDIPVYAVISDLCASGCYYIIAAADKIYAQKASMIGSIGVLMNGFGFTEIMKTLGVERRLFTAGKSKGFLDPFAPVKDSDVAHIKSMLAHVHQLFIDRVKEGRGERLKANDTLFTGLIWTGEQAKEMGLIDDFASTGYVAREIIKEKKLLDFTKKDTLLNRFTDRLGVSVGAYIMTQMSEPSMR